MNTDKIAEQLEQAINKPDKKAKENGNQKVEREVKSLVQNIIGNVDPKNIVVRDPTDLKSIVDIYNKTIERESNGKGGGQLPPLSTGQENIIEKAVHVNYTSIPQDDGSVKQEKSISVADIADMTPDQVAELMMEKEELQNNSNASQML